MSTSNDGYRVGKGRPPKHTQFKKGQSGNPSGRKKRRTLDDEIVDLLDQEVDLTINGTPTRLTYRRAIGVAAITKAVRGDLRASEFVRVLEACNGSEEPSEAAGAPGTEGLIERFYERYTRRRSLGSDPEPDHD